MNWETYSTMTVEQKEEYNFKFKDKEFVVDGKEMVSTASIFMMIVMQFLMVIYLAMTQEAFEHLRDQITILLVAATRVISVIGIIILVTVISYVAQMIYNFYKERKWIKSNNIKVIKTTPFWRKDGKNVSVR